MNGNNQIQPHGDPVNEKNINTIARGAMVVFAGMLVGSALRYVLQVIVARGLGTGLFGLFILGVTVSRILGMFSELGLPQGLIRFIAIYEGLRDKARLKGVIELSLKSSFVAAAIIGFLTYVFSGFLASEVFDKPGLIPVLKLVALIIPFSTLTTMLVFSLQGFKLLKYKMAVREIFEPLIRLILVAIVLAAGWKLPAVFLAYLLTSISALFLAFYFVKKVFPRITDRQLLPVYETRKLFAFSWPLLFIFFFGSLLLWTDTVILALFRTSTEVGIYGATQRTALLCSIIITAFNSIFAPIAADLSSRGQRTQLETLFKTVTKWTLLTSSPLCIGFFLFPGEILGIFGVRFTEGRVSLIILSVAWLLHSAMSSAGLLLTMSGRSRLQLVNASLLLLANIVLNFLLIPGLGAKGAALATAISIILFDIVSVIEVAMIAKMIPFRMDFFKVLAAGGIMLSAGMAILKFKWIPLPPLAGALLVFTVVFFVYLLVIWILGIGKEERLVLKDLLRRLGKSAPFLSH